MSNDLPLSPSSPPYNMGAFRDRHTLRGGTLGIPGSKTADPDLHIPCAKLFIAHTISQDRTGDQSTVMSKILAPNQTSFDHTTSQDRTGNHSTAKLDPSTTASAGFPFGSDESRGRGLRDLQDATRQPHALSRSRTSISPKKLMLDEHDLNDTSPLFPNQTQRAFNLSINPSNTSAYYPEGSTQIWPTELKRRNTRIRRYPGDRRVPDPPQTGM
jgi:hypothetical protein